MTAVTLAPFQTRVYTAAGSSWLDPALGWKRGMLSYLIPSPLIECWRRGFLAFSHPGQLARDRSRQGAFPGRFIRGCRICASCVCLQPTCFQPFGLRQIWTPRSGPNRLRHHRLRIAFRAWSLKRLIRAAIGSNPRHHFACCAGRLQQRPASRLAFCRSWLCCHVLHGKTGGREQGDRWPGRWADLHGRKRKRVTRF